LNTPRVTARWPQPADEDCARRVVVAVTGRRVAVVVGRLVVVGLAVVVVVVVVVASAAELAGGGTVVGATGAGKAIGDGAAVVSTPTTTPMTIIVPMAMASTLVRTIFPLTLTPAGSSFPTEPRLLAPGQMRHPGLVPNAGPAGGHSFNGAPSGRVGRCTPRWRVRPNDAVGAVHGGRGVALHRSDDVEAALRATASG
jgi:hypothetical protein